MQATTLLLFVLVVQTDTFTLLPQQSSTGTRGPCVLYRARPLAAAADQQNQDGSNRNAEFWAQQKAIAEQLQSSTEKSLKREQMEKYERRSLALVGDTAYISCFLFAGLWMIFDNPFTPFSYVFGAVMGLAYTYGLAKYVAALGGSAEDANSIQGAGVGEARFAFLILLFIIVGRFRSEGLQEIPAISGFFTYQIASLFQGLREIND
jgi:hypothetical protein